MSSEAVLLCMDCLRTALTQLRRPTATARLVPSVGIRVRGRQAQAVLNLAGVGRNGRTQNAPFL